jgi:hypothetical protein
VSLARFILSHTHTSTTRDAAGDRLDRVRVGRLSIMHAVYLVHLKRPVQGHHRHRLAVVNASASDVSRLHQTLTLAPIIEAAGFVLVRVWKHQAEPLEKRLKRQKHHSRLCPVCNPTGCAKRTRRTLAALAKAAHPHSSTERKAVRHAV